MASARETGLCAGIRAEAIEPRDVGASPALLFCDLWRAAVFITTSQVLLLESTFLASSESPAEKTD